MTGITRCNTNNGRCPDNQCCSRDGICGTENEHCLFANGSNPIFRLCYWIYEENKICKHALKYSIEFSSKWSPNTFRKFEDIEVGEGELKCNLFVYEMLRKSGIDIGTPNKYNCGNIFKTAIKKSGFGDCDHRVTCNSPRPPTTEDWFNGNVDDFWEGEEGRQLSRPGDIIVIVYKKEVSFWDKLLRKELSEEERERDVHHVGIVSGVNSTISANTFQNVIINNEWGFRCDNNEPDDRVRVYRYAHLYGRHIVEVEKKKKRND